MQSENHILPLVRFALSAGRAMLENGAETYRVEETVTRICMSRGIRYVQIFAIPTGIFITVDDGNDVYTYVETIRKRDINLRIISRINELSRSFVVSDMTVNTATTKLARIQTSLPYKKFYRYVAAGSGGGFFTVLYGGRFFEFLCAFIAIIMVTFVSEKLHAIDTSHFLNYVCGGLTAVLTSILLSAGLMMLGYDNNTDQIIIGAIMPLVPGVAITNAVRDTISGDYVSGLSRAAEAVVVALGIAAGVGTVLNLYYRFIGGIL